MRHMHDLHLQNGARAKNPQQEETSRQGGQHINETPETDRDAETTRYAGGEGLL